MLQSDHQQHVDPPEPHPVKRTLWQRWMAWSGSFLVLSILVHILVIGGFAVLVVQVVQGRKEKLKFTAPPPSPAGAAEHKVKPSKKTAAAAPAISKRIVSTAANASISLPAMDMNSSSGPDVMASVMSGLGGAGLGAGAGAGSAVAAIPAGGLTAFGFKGKGQPVGLIGTLYDLKQDKNRQPTEIKDDGIFRNRDEEKDKGYKFEMFERYRAVVNNPSQHSRLSEGSLNAAKVINNFFSGGWDPNVLERFYKSSEPMTAYQIAIPAATQQDALKAFGVEKEIKPNRFLIHYKGTLTAPRDGSYRFAILLDNGMLAIRFDGNNVLGSLSPLIRKDFFRDEPNKDGFLGYKVKASKWLSLRAGQKYPIEILMVIGGETIGDNFGCFLMMEEKNPPKPYLLSEFQWQSKQGLQYQTGDALKNPKIYRRLPLFALRKDLPIPSFKIPKFDPPTGMSEGGLKWWKENGPWLPSPDLAPESLVFPGSK